MRERAHLDSPGPPCEDRVRDGPASGGKGLQGSGPHTPRSRTVLERLTFLTQSPRDTRPRPLLPQATPPSTEGRAHAPEAGPS